MVKINVVKVRQDEFDQTMEKLRKAVETTDAARKKRDQLVTQLSHAELSLATETRQAKELEEKLNSKWDALTNTKWGLS